MTEQMKDAKQYADEIGMTFKVETTTINFSDGSFWFRDDYQAKVFRNMIDSVLK